VIAMMEQLASQLLVLRGWLATRTERLRREPDRGEGIVTTIVIIVGFVLIALAAIAILKVTVLNGANGVQTQ
jgi:hypothetical protein